MDTQPSKEEAALPPYTPSRGFTQVPGKDIEEGK
jgi:hypothetical protein